MSENLINSDLYLKHNFKKIDELAGDASKRMYFRVVNGGESKIICLDNDYRISKSSTFIELNEVFIKNNVNVPNIIETSESEGLILQEDLGDETLLMELNKTQDKDEEFNLLEKSIDELIKINRINYSTSLSFDSEKLMSEIDVTIENLFIKYKGISEDKIVFRKDFQKICNRLNVNEKVFCHRDYHSRNIMICDGEIRVIDYQDARWGIPQYDLVSLLDDCYYDVREENKNSLKKYYWDNYLEQLKIQKNYSEFLELYDYMLIQRVFKAIGSFCLIHNRDKNSSYLKYVDGAFNKIINVLNGYTEFHNLQNQLKELYSEN